MGHTSKEQYLESCRQRYPRRNRAGKSAMIDEVSDNLGWDRKHAIKALGRKVTLGSKAARRGSKPTHGESEQTVIIAIVERIEEDRHDEIERAGEIPAGGSVGADSVTASVATAPSPPLRPPPRKPLSNPPPKNQKPTKRRVS